jgi:hypothetical protein
VVDPATLKHEISIQPRDFDVCNPRRRIAKQFREPVQMSVSGRLLNPASQHPFEVRCCRAEGREIIDFAGHIPLPAVQPASQASPRCFASIAGRPLKTAVVGSCTLLYCPS